MTEVELLASETFIGFCGRWEEDRHCPFPLIDWCLERDWPEGAEAVRWAVEKEERQVLYGRWPSAHPGRTCPLPGPGFGGRVSWELTGKEDASMSWCDEFPVKMTGVFRSFPAAIAYYLTHFDVTLAAKYPPKRLAVPA